VSKRHAVESGTGTHCAARKPRPRTCRGSGPRDSDGAGRHLAQAVVEDVALGGVLLEHLQRNPPPPHTHRSRRAIRHPPLKNTPRGHIPRSPPAAGAAASPQGAAPAGPHRRQRRRQCVSATAPATRHGGRAASTVPRCCFSCCALLLLFHSHGASSASSRPPWPPARRPYPGPGRRTFTPACTSFSCRFVSACPPPPPHPATRHTLGGWPGCASSHAMVRCPKTCAGHPARLLRPRHTRRAPPVQRTPNILHLRRAGLTRTSKPGHYAGCRRRRGACEYAGGLCP
jgi:hypothetical protein